ncbi:MAG: DUF362 domain-containing protein [Limisphaerales bacterium]
MVTFTIWCVKKATNILQLSMVYILMLSKAVAKVIFALALAFSASAERAEIDASGRVLIIEHPAATQAFTPQSEPVRQMVETGLARFTGTDTEKLAWQSLITAQDTIGIKVHSAPGRTSGTRPLVVAAVIESMLHSGITADKIVIWDRRLVDLRLAGYYELAGKYNVGIAGATDEGFNPGSYYPTPLLGKLVYGDLEFGQKGEGIGRNSYVSKLLTKRLTKIINVTPLLNHNQAGVSGALYGLAMASVDNILRFEDLDRLGTAVPEIYALPDLADKVALNIVDALICQYRGEERSLLHYSTSLNQLWFSRDPVAVDVLAIQVLDQNRAERRSRRGTLQIYSNAALMDLGVADTNRIKIERVDLTDAPKPEIN